MKKEFHNDLAVFNLRKRFIAIKDLCNPDKYISKLDLPKNSSKEIEEYLMGMHFENFKRMNPRGYERSIDDLFNQYTKELIDEKERVNNYDDINEIYEALYSDPCVIGVDVEEVEG